MIDMNRIGCLFILLVFLASCKKEAQKEYKKSGFNSSQEFLDNADIKHVINVSGIPIYEGTNPPNIEGEYSTNECTVVSASKNMSQVIGVSLSSTFKFSNQTSSQIDIAESAYGQYAKGSGAFITGSGKKFTLWIEAHQSTGSDVVALMSGNVLINGDIQIDNVSLYTNSPPQPLIIGDWWESTGPFRLL